MGNIWCCVAEEEVVVPHNDGGFSNKYKILHQLGKGSTARCYQCVSIVNKGSFAVKIIDKKRILMMYSSLLGQFRKEMDILHGLNHPNIIQLEEMFEGQSFIHLVTEVASGGELFDYLTCQPSNMLTEETVSFFIRQLFSAVAYMHDHGVIHRDLKLENILLAEAPNKDGTFRDIRLKIIDFGLSKTFDTCEIDEGGVSPIIGRSFFGTVGYISPEMMKRSSYTRAVDVWSLGVVAFVLLCGVFPFNDNGNHFKKSHDYKLRFPPWNVELSESSKDLLESLLEINPQKRFTAKTAMRHPWVSGITASPEIVLQSPGILKSIFGNLSITTNEARLGPVDELVMSPLLLDDDQLKSSIEPFIAKRKSAKRRK